MTSAPRFARPLLLVLALASVVLSGCGEKKAVTLEGKEGERINLGGLVYQVQLSRILNVRDVEDAQYTRALPAPARDESYYGVFMRVDNEESEKPLTPIGLESMKIVDAGENEFRPIPIDAPGMAYASVELGKGDRIPVPDSAADNNPEKGAVIVFKIPYKLLENRPLILKLEGPGGKSGEIVLDV